MIFERDDRRKELLIKEGRVLAAHSNLIPEGVETVLSRGLVNPAEIATFQAEISSRPLGDSDAALLTALRRAERVTVSQADWIRTALLEDRLLNLFGWFSGRFEVHPGAELPDAFVPLIPDSPTHLCELIERVENALHRTTASFTFLSDLDPPSSGELRTLGAAKLILACVHHKATGRLFVERGARRKMFHWVGGRIQSVVSTDPNDTLGTTLRRWNFLDLETVERLEIMKKSRGDRLRDLIRDEKLLAEDKRLEALSILHFERILETFSWRSGNYEFRGSYGHEFRPPASGSLRAETTRETPSFIVPEQAELEPIARVLGEGLATRSKHHLFWTALPITRSLLKLVGELAATSNRPGHRTLLVDVSRAHGSNRNPALWTSEASWQPLVELFPASRPVDYLRLQGEEANWSEPEGKERIRQLLKSLSASYRAIFWIGSPLRRDSPLNSDDAEQVVVLTSHRTGKAELRAWLETSPIPPLAGFVFQEAAPPLYYRWAREAVDLMARWRRPS